RLDKHAHQAQGDKGADAQKGHAQHEPLDGDKQEKGMILRRMKKRLKAIHNRRLLEDSIQKSDGEKEKHHILQLRRLPSPVQKAVLRVPPPAADQSRPTRGVGDDRKGYGGEETDPQKRLHQQNKAHKENQHRQQTDPAESNRSMQGAPWTASRPFDGTVSPAQHPIRREQGRSEERRVGKGAAGGGRARR